MGSRKREIVEATLALLAERPLGEVTTRRIARRVGVSQPALFRHFRGRDAMLVAAVDQVGAEVADLVAASLADPAPPLARAVELAVALATRVEARPGLLRLLLADLAAETAAHGRLTRLVDGQRALATALVREAGLAGADLAGRAFVAAVQGTLAQWLLAGQPAGVVPQVRGVIELWAAGVAARGPAIEGPVGAARLGLRALDVRPILAGGADPLSHILEALEGVAEDGVLCLVAPFRPTPLIALLSRRGYTVAVMPSPADAVLVEIAGVAAPAALDLQQLPPPEPLEQVLIAAAGLAPGAALYVRLPRYPRMLLPRLAERGLEWTALELPDGTGRLHARRAR